MQDEWSKNRRNPILISIFIFGVFIIIILIISLIGILNTPRKNEIVIDNFFDYNNDVPDDLKSLIFKKLYNAVRENTESQDKIPEKGAKIRDNSFYTHTDSDEKRSTHFIVDIDGIRQSYNILFYWYNNKNKNDLNGGYQIEFGCLSKNDVIYSDFTCNISSDNVFLDEYPILSSLPIVVDYFDVDTTRVYYEIKYEITSDSTINILINDHSGKNYERALKKISSMGYDPDDYKIIYNDTSDENKHGRAM